MEREYALRQRSSGRVLPISAARGARLARRPLFERFFDLLVRDSPGAPWRVASTRERG